MVAADVAPVGVGVTDVGLSEHVEPAGAPEQVSATESAKLFKPTTVTVTLAGEPAATLVDMGETAIVKSALVVVPVPVSVAVCGLLGTAVGDAQRRADGSGDRRCERHADRAARAGGKCRWASVRLRKRRCASARDADDDVAYGSSAVVLQRYGLRRAGRADCPDFQN